jgi:hypothetical protein
MIAFWEQDWAIGRGQNRDYAEDARLQMQMQPTTTTTTSTPRQEMVQ